ncbi:MAG: RNA-binding transcriptional accessory protein, partial [Spirochaetales bacterium]|nr:RNA-binding transcriptional accessory protein [Spirochaetales bacterium]
LMIKNDFAGRIAGELKISTGQVGTVIGLLDEGSSVPFIARYRKEATGELDEVAILNIRDRLEELKKFDSRVRTILKSLREQDLLTKDLEEKVKNAETVSILEDIYLPYKPKRRTRAMAAREKGLEPLADYILKNQTFSVNEEAARYLDVGKGVSTVLEALAGARDIIAERISEDSSLRSEIREYFRNYAVLTSKLIKGKDLEGVKYRDYFSWAESASRSPSHRVLAIFRGTSEGFLRFHILPEEEGAIKLIKKRYLKIEVGEDICGGQVLTAIKDSYKRLLGPSMETDMKNSLKEKADSEAIRVFGSNLSELLLEAPLGQKRVLAVDPGLRTGCKIVCLDSSGKLLTFDTIFPLPPANRTEEASKKMKALIEKYDIQAIAVGNGTGGREALAFCRDLSLDGNIIITAVNENGASVYSASEAGREEFPDHDLTVRGSVSIGRRLMDPLSELIKIDPKSIGVGQYQHDVDQKELKRSLDDVVAFCVNRVGVEVNTASARLLQYVSGLSVKLASAIVRYRDENGPFKSRSSFLSVAGMGSKSFEQSAAFLRIRGAVNPLDNSAVHPESYYIVEKMAASVGVVVGELIKNEAILKQIFPSDYIDDTTGLPTIRDIIDELKKPGRDPRESFTLFSFKEGVTSPEDLEEGMILSGIITNVTAFGAFADIGVHQDGLVHISQLADKFVRNPMDIVKVNQRVTVKVISVDLERKRISLSMKGL